MFIQVTCSQNFPFNEVTQVAYFCFFVGLKLARYIFLMLAGLETAASFPGTMNENVFRYIDLNLSQYMKNVVFFRGGSKSHQ